ncbi:MAG: ATP-dependent DNA helicase RecG [Planctomycetaceae bacterium]
MNDSPLQTEVQYVKGVGPRRAELYAKLGLRTVEDLLWDLPRDVLDLTDVRSVRELEADVPVSVRGQVVDLDGRNVSGGKNLTAVLLDCGDGYLRGVWFNQHWMLRRFRMGETVLFSGKPKRRGGRWEINNPRVQWLEEDDSITSGGVLPRYRLTEGLRMEQRRAAARGAVEKFAEFVPELLPEAFRERQKLPGIRTALTGVHSPRTLDDFQTSRNRLLFDDLFEFQLGLALKRRMFKKHQSAPVLPTNAKIDSRIRRLFPFEFTEGQNSAVREIAADLASGRAMHRLLQADVGAGKTAVAIYGMLVTVAAGYQTALMAPTEVLAQQHWETLEDALQHSRVKRRLLTGQLTAAQRRSVLEDIRAGDVQLVVGTQALIQSDVQFRNLGLAVIDEQHKFGVMQRAHFSLKPGAKPPSGELPHILVMTATPIPRSLCLTLFGDLDVTVISELPPGRQKVVTTRIREAGRAKVWDFFRRQLAAGRQAYVVCPRVEDALEATGEPISAESVCQSLHDGELRDFRVGLVHGQMSRDDKAAAMTAFREAETQALVSTTVIEVGVDVPNATLMVVLQAERFGLSQLHQLRGRISRGKFQGYCFLFSDSESDEAGKRLWALESTTDGFRIAETDFEIRGPGDVLGTQQHGDLPLKVADIRRDAKLLKQARAAAFELVNTGEVDSPEFAPLKISVLERFGEWLNLPQTG